MISKIKGAIGKCVKVVNKVVNSVVKKAIGSMGKYVKSRNAGQSKVNNQLMLLVNIQTSTDQNEMAWGGVIYSLLYGNDCIIRGVISSGAVSNNEDYDFWSKVKSSQESATEFINGSMNDFLKDWIDIVIFGYESYKAGETENLRSGWNEKWQSGFDWAGNKINRLGETLYSHDRWYSGFTGALFGGVPEDEEGGWIQGVGAFFYGVGKGVGGTAEGLGSVVIEPEEVITALFGAVVNVDTVAPALWGMLMQYHEDELVNGSSVARGEFLGVIVLEIAVTIATGGGAKAAAIGENAGDTSTVAQILSLIDTVENSTDYMKIAKALEELGDVVKTAKILENMDDVVKAAKILENMDDVTTAAKILENMDDVTTAIKILDNIDDEATVTKILDNISDPALAERLRGDVKIFDDAPITDKGEGVNFSEGLNEEDIGDTIVDTDTNKNIANANKTRVEYGDQYTRVNRKKVLKPNVEIYRY